MKLNKIPSWIKKLPGIIISILCIMFIIRIFFKTDITWDKIDLNFLLSTTIFFVALLLVSMIVNAILFNHLLFSLSGTKMSFKDIFVMYMRSNFGKYLPGNVMQFVGRNILCKKYSIDHHITALATLIEIATICISSVIIVITFTIVQHETGFITHILNIINIKLSIAIILVGTILFIIMLTIAIKINRSFLKLTPRLLKTIFLLILNNLFFLSFIGIGFYILIIKSSIPQMQFSSKVFITILYFNLSWLIGFLTPGAPGGVGVREFSMVYFLSPTFGDEKIVIAAVIFRIINTISDSVLFALTFIKKRRKL